MCIEPALRGSMLSIFSEHTINEDFYRFLLGRREVLLCTVVICDHQDFYFDHLIKGIYMRRNHASGTNSKLQVSIQPNIGLDRDARHAVIEILNTLMADEAVLTSKTRSACWHVRGPGFLDLHTLFDQQFNELNIISNEIAERVRMLDGYAISSFGELLDYTRLEEQPGEVPDIMSLLADHEASIRFLREDARKCFEEYEDHGTFDTFIRFIRVHEKIAWILRSYIEPERSQDEMSEKKIQNTLR